MKRFLRMAGPVILLGVIFVVIYFLTIPKVELPGDAEVDAAISLLESYGYESAQVTHHFDYVHLGVWFVGFITCVMGYFYYYDWCEKRKIQKVIDYVRKINQRVYDLKLDENSEDDLSLLANELYKTAVLLQEAARNDRARVENMENALADISHQLRTPLTSLQIMLDNLYDNPDLDLAVRQDFLLTAGRQVEQMSELVIMLLNLAKLDNGTLRMRPKVVTVSELLKDAVGCLGALAELNDVSIKIFGDLDARIKVDRRWQAEALANIVKNCIEHSRAGQTVKIEVRKTVIFTRIIISDDGDGILPEDLRHVFERFYKARNARSESVGIGLAFAKTVIEADGGQVRVRSTAGEGAMFIVGYFGG